MRELHIHIDLFWFSLAVILLAGTKTLLLPQIPWVLVLVPYWLPPAATQLVEWAIGLWDLSFGRKKK